VALLARKVRGIAERTTGLAGAVEVRDYQLITSARARCWANLTIRSVLRGAATALTDPAVSSIAQCHDPFLESAPSNPDTLRGHDRATDKEPGRAVWEPSEFVRDCLWCSCCANWLRV